MYEETEGAWARKRKDVNAGGAIKSYQQNTSAGIAIFGFVQIA